MGGEHSPAPATGFRDGGSSPRGRGTRGFIGVSFRAWRIIPAWAGNTSGRSIVPYHQRDHPRVGGEHNHTGIPTAPNEGSSPRGRGTPSVLSRQIGAIRIIPAWAGNTLMRPTPARRSRDHPRVGGEHSVIIERLPHCFGSSPRGRGTLAYTGTSEYGARIIPRVGGEHRVPTSGVRVRSGSSPRGRGTHGVSPSSWTAAGIIPAWAGNTFQVEASKQATTDHPRVGGEHTTFSTRNIVTCGSSPRGRGTRAVGKNGYSRWRIIPAWAGNTAQNSA